MYIASINHAPHPTFSEEVKQALSQLFSARAECFTAMEKLEHLGALAVVDATFPINQLFASVDWCFPSWQNREIPNNEQAAYFFADAVKHGEGGILKITGSHLSIV